MFFDDVDFDFLDEEDVFFFDDDDLDFPVAFDAGFFVTALDFLLAEAAAADGFFFYYFNSSDSDSEEDTDDSLALLFFLAIPLLQSIEVCLFPCCQKEHEERKRRRKRKIISLIYPLYLTAKKKHRQPARHALFACSPRLLPPSPSIVRVSNKSTYN